MGPISVYDRSVKAILEEWLEDSQEVFVDLYYPHSGASGTFYFVASLAQFDELASTARSGARLTLLRQRQFPIRGIADDTLLNRAVDEIQDGEWYLIVEPVFYPAELSYLGVGDSHEELVEDLKDLWGTSVCIGTEPDIPAYWVENEADDTLVTFKP